MHFFPNLEIVTLNGGELWHAQAQNGVNFDFGVQFDLEGQGQSHIWHICDIFAYVMSRHHWFGHYPEQYRSSETIVLRTKDNLQLNKTK